MKTIVVYESGTGFTAQYAEWIAEAVGGVCAPLKKVTKDEIASFDRIIFGGWIFGNGIMGFQKLLSMAKPFAVFAVGSMPSSEDVVSAIQKQNSIGDIPFFYFEGGFHFEKLGFFKKAILKMLKKSLLKKENKTPTDEFMAKYLCTSFDHSSKDKILPLVEFCK